jgi:hypothetical protein
VPPLTAAPSTVAATSASPAVVVELPDGRSFGYIRSVDAGLRTLQFDLADFLEGDAADRAAVEDGVVDPGQHVENDYYIRNVNKRLRTLPYPADVSIRVVGDPPDLVDGTLDDFIAGFANDEVVPFGGGPTYRGSHTQYWLTVKGGAVSMIEELYLP